MSMAIIASKPGGLEVLKWENIDVPDPKDDEVKISHTAIGVNFIDTYHRTGRYPGMNYPSILGVEGAGKIIKVGNNITNFSVGDRVCYPLAIGAYSEERIINEDILIKIPDNISDEDAAAGITKGITVHHLFNESRKILEDDWILFHAAAGGVGLIACQWAKAKGFNLIGTVSNNEKKELALKYGAKKIINYKEQSFAEKVMEITNQKGVIAAYDGIGSDSPRNSIKCLSVFGTLCTFGAASGPSNLTIEDLPASIQYTKGSIATLIQNREKLHESSKEFLKLLGNGDLNIQIGQTYDLKDAARAHSDLENRKTTGSIILKP
ncbi:MAG: quinone oxidoreductase [Rhodospirillaceae bacterium]|nr:quinone oxidoreductase [Rhodospirillaceae bacterium]